jgi:hypothetical protein
MIIPVINLLDDLFSSLEATEVNLGDYGIGIIARSHEDKERGVILVNGISYTIPEIDGEFLDEDGNGIMRLANIVSLIFAEDNDVA